MNRKPVHNLFLFIVGGALFAAGIFLLNWHQGHRQHKRSSRSVPDSNCVAAQPGLEILRTLEIEQGIGQGFKGA